MYSKKNIINRKKTSNNFIEENKNVSNQIKGNQKIYQKNYLTYRGDSEQSFNYDYLKEYYKKSKNPRNTKKNFYIKKTLKFINDKTSNLDTSDYQKNYLQTIGQGRIKKKQNLIYTLNPHNSNSQSKINEFDYSTNLSKGSLLENLNNYNYNISGYNTINNVGIEIKLDNNNYRSINNDNIQKSITYGINKYNYISKPKTNYYIMQNNLREKKDKLRKNYLYKSTPDLTKFLNLINDNSKLYSKDNTYLETYSDKNKLSIISKNDNNINYENQYSSLNTDVIISKRRKKRTKSNVYSINKIKKEVQFRKNEFEKMRSIEKRIKKYFIENSVSFKNRELYHQSAIIIQSNFRSFVVKQKVKLFLKYRDVIGFLIKIFYTKKSLYYNDFMDKIKSYIENDDINSINKYLLDKKHKKLKIEKSNNFSIINNGQTINKLNESIVQENKILKNKLNESEIQIKKLKKENEFYQLKENQYNGNTIAKNEKEILKIKENIENVSKELEQINGAKKKNNNQALSYNLRNYININNQNFRRPNTLNQFSDINNNKNTNEFKQLFLKYLITIKNIKTNERKKLYFYKLKTNIKIEELNEIIQVGIIKHMVDIMQNKLKQNVHLSFCKLLYRYLFTKYKKPFLYVKNKKLKNTVRILENSDDF